MHCSGGDFLFDGLLFDLDGTLWDSIDPICVSWRRVLASQMTRENVTGYMGMRLPDIARKVLPNTPPEEIQPLLKELLEEENAHLAVHGGVLYPQVPETLKLLARDYPLCIVSNCQVGYIEAFFQAHGLKDYFIDYENPGRTGKDKADNIALVVERNGMKRPLYIGDTQSDFDAASGAGVPFLHAAYGFGTIDRPVPFVRSFEEIPAAVTRLSPP